jgi:hypothetical protein
MKMHLVCFVGLLFIQLAFSQPKTLPMPRAIPADTTFVGELKINIVIPESCYVYYTLDGTIPSEKNGFYYVSQFEVTINKPTILKAVSIYKYNLQDTILNSSILVVNYQQKLSSVYEFNNPIFFVDSIKVVLLQPQNATIYFTMDGTIPDSTSDIFTKPIIIYKTTTFKAFARKDGYIDCSVKTITFRKYAESIIDRKKANVKRITNNNNSYFTASGRKVERFYQNKKNQRIIKYQKK